MRILQVPSMMAALNNVTTPGHLPNGTAMDLVNHQNSTNSTFMRTLIIANGTDITSRFDTANTNFPPRSWLGFGLDMTAITPLDITSVASSVLTHTRLIALKDGGEKQELGDISWLVPPGVSVNQDVDLTGTSYAAYKNGEQAAHALSIDATLSARYTAIEGDVSASYAIKKAFQDTYQYALFSYNQQMLRVEFEDYGGEVNERFLRQRMDRIAKFNPRDPEIIDQYRSFFASIGSHVITAVNYGGRLQLNVWADNSDSDVDKEFNVDVAAEFNGLTTGGKVTAGVKGEEQYQTFEESVQKTSSCLGGDAELASNIGANPSADGVFETFQDWVKTAQTRPNIMTFQTAAMWDLMDNANDSALARRGPDVRQAYNWIVENPEQHQTKARITITSNWGELGLLTPSAYILRDPQQPDDPAIFFSTTKVGWNSGTGVGREITVDFIIVNDGSPIDIELSHGSEGATPGHGSITVEFNGKAYQNDKLTDNNWNTQRFMACPVDPHAMERPGNPVNVATS